MNPPTDCRLPPAVSHDELLAITLRALSERALGRRVPDGLIPACLHQLAQCTPAAGTQVARISALALADWTAPRAAH